MSTTNNDLRLAVLIDADNAPRTSMKAVMSEIAIYGKPTIKRIYGDWTTPNLSTWKPILLENAITPMQQYGYTTGKNSTDSAMIIDAMDILYSGHIDGFVLVSSDSDFTRLAIRLREAGMKVFGIGERKTPAPFIAACDKFVYIEVIRAAADADEKDETTAEDTEKKTETSEKKVTNTTANKQSVGKNNTVKATSPSAKKISNSATKLLLNSLEDIADEDGYASLGELGNLLIKKQPDFDSRNFGYKKLSQLVKSIGLFEVDERKLPNSKAKLIYVRAKKTN